MTAPAYRIDGREATRESFYAAACDPRRSVVVEACAGAGKTWMLVSRILRALLDGAEPQQILAITFTRKAAGEMRARLDQWLRECARADEAGRVKFLGERGLPPEAAQRLAPALGALHEQVLAGARPVQLRTFHAWFGQLVRQAPLQLLARLGLPAEFELLEEIGELETAVMRRLHRRVAADPALRADFTTLVSRHRRSTVESWLRAAWHRGAEIELADAAGTLEPSVPDARTVFPQWAGAPNLHETLMSGPLRPEVDELARLLGQRSGKRAAEAAGRLRLALEADDPVQGHAALRAALYTQAGGRKAQLGGLVQQDRVCDRLDAFDEVLRQQHAHEDHHRMLRLARVLLAEYGALKRQQRLVDMADLERAALALLSDPPAAGWVQERLDLQLRHLLIDEFQDTSPLQWQALYAWLSGYAGAGGGRSGQRPLTLFVVGDPKQSIYRFRRAEPRVFAAAREFVAVGLDGQVLECDHTRRNAPAVLTLLNAVFGQAVVQDGWAPFRAHTTESAEAGAVQALPAVERADPAPAAGRDGWRDSLTEPRDEPERRRRLPEARQVAAALAAALAAGEPAKELMVLARRREPLAAVAEALAELQIACVRPEATELRDLPESADVIALLDVLASPAQDLSLARALRSPLFGASDDELRWLAVRAADPRRPWLRALLAAADPPGALARAQALLRGWAAALPGIAPHDLVDRVLHEGDLPARLAASVPPHRRALAALALRSLVAGALAQGGGRHVSLYRFVRALKAGRLKLVDDLPPDAVRLLTVHGAKGLEADQVFIVDAEPQRRNADHHTLLVDWPADETAPTLVAFVASEGRPPPSLEPFVARELEARAREELNGLYVAVTRARRRLVVSATMPLHAEPVPSWWRRLQPHAEPIEPPSAAGAGQATPPCTDQPLIQRRKAEPLPVRPPAPRDARAAALGRAVHRLLEWIARPEQPLPRADWPRAARRAALAAALPADEGAEVLAIASRIAASADCARFFDPARLRWSGNEVPLAAAGEALRVDRLVLLDGATGPEWWVLDYKLNAAPGELDEYREQLAAYRAALRAAVGPGVVVRAAFVTGSGGLVET